jgi:hypothetical protein
MTHDRVAHCHLHSGAGRGHCALTTSRCAVIVGFARVVLRATNQRCHRGATIVVNGQSTLFAFTILIGRTNRLRAYRMPLTHSTYAFAHASFARLAIGIVGARIRATTITPHLTISSRALAVRMRGTIGVRFARQMPFGAGTCGHVNRRIARSDRRSVRISIRFGHPTNFRRNDRNFGVSGVARFCDDICRRNGRYGDDGCRFIRRLCCLRRCRTTLKPKRDEDRNT